VFQTTTVAANGGGACNGTVGGGGKVCSCFAHILHSRMPLACSSCVRVTTGIPLGVPLAWIS
jgi:hypothetical protein